MGVGNPIGLRGNVIDPKSHKVKKTESEFFQFD